VIDKQCWLFGIIGFVTGLLLGISFMLILATNNYEIITGVKGRQVPTGPMNLGLPHLEIDHFGGDALQLYFPIASSKQEVGFNYLQIQLNQSGNIVEMARSAGDRQWRGFLHYSDTELGVREFLRVFMAEDLLDDNMIAKWGQSRGGPTLVDDDFNGMYDYVFFRGTKYIIQHRLVEE